MDKDKLYLEHIILSIEKINKFLENTSLEDFAQSDIQQSAVIRELEVIGEATKNLSEKLRRDNQEIPWKLITGTRDKLIHDYMGVDMFLVYDIYERYLPELEKKVRYLLEFYS